ncbi:DoxX family protein [Streptomyces pactum]|uniref:DoxX family protein n=1 Tax=Streptomyces pactum TaxID=68249 RepID=A0ABS0NQV9_9ACTN|nr:DoxX family protein [Streptomyces pactum]MBH5337472.1 DoxX family protein [Streptomyces pactum]
MSPLDLTVTGITVAANAAIAAADLARARFVLANSAEVGVPPSWLPGLAALKAAGAAGLLLGLLGHRSLGITAGLGLVLFFTGAVVAHLRARVHHNMAFPLAFLGLAVASTALAVTR